MKNLFYYILLLFPIVTKAQSDTVHYVSLNIAGECIDQSVWTNCDFTVINSQSNPIGITASPSIQGIEVEFPYNESDGSYSIILDESCLNSNGVSLNSYVVDLNSFMYLGSSSVIVNNEMHLTHNYSIALCSEELEPLRLFSVDINFDNCGTSFMHCIGTVYKNETPIAQVYGEDGIELTNQVYDNTASYTIRFNEACLDSIGTQISQYEFQFNPQFSHQDSFAMYYTQTLTIECDSPNVADTCVNLYSGVIPWIGYYQNTTNQIYFYWGNSSYVSESATVTIDMPAGVTPVVSSFSYPFTVSGSQLILNTTMPAMSSFQDIITFNVPGGINNGLVHTYGINIYSLDANDCDTSNNTDYLSMIVGNSYDPNDKTVNQPTIISPTVQDEFVYTIRFQNTGTAPAQDVYIIDTLSQNLDWSTFVLLESSHPVVVTDLGNGVKRFTYDGIWLPDSTTNLLESQGFFSYKISEKPTNGEGVEILNTAYIYFDHNPAIITNTTFNINTSSDLGLNTIKEYAVSLSPNPVSTSLNVTADGVIDELKVYDVTGKECLQITPAELSSTFSVENLEPGIYFVNVLVGKELQTLRFIKK